MIDRVSVRCPGCGNAMWLQSRAGPRRTTEYRGEDGKVPVEIARDVEGKRLTCRHCGTISKVVAHVEATAAVSAHRDAA